MKETKMHLVMLAAFALTSCGQESPPAQTKPRKMSIGEFLHKAVVDGLKEDAADRAWVKERIADQRNLFVLKCPICEPIRSGFAEYGNAQSKDTPLAPAEGKGVPKDIVDDLESSTRLTQLTALERLVDRYVSRHYERLSMTAEERRAMHAALEHGKKEGMEMKELGPQKKDFGDFCPSCNGAAKAT
jgi:hypothetical protein